MIASAFPDREKTPELDWRLINEFDPQIIQQTNDVDSMNTFIKYILPSDFTQDQQIAKNPNILKLLQLFQVSTYYLFDCQSALKDKIATKNENLKSLVKLLRHYKSQLIKAKETLKNSENYAQCPSCGRRFKSTQLLDLHMEKRHQQLRKAWRSIRLNEIYNASTKAEQKMQNEINDLQKQVNDLSKQNYRQQFYDQFPENSHNDKSRVNPFQNQNLSEENASHSPMEIQETKEPEPPIPTPSTITKTIDVTNQFEIESDDDDAKNHGQNNIAQEIVKQQAIDFLNHKRKVTPFRPETVDAIVLKMSQIIHEQSKHIRYAETADNEPPSEVKKDISNDVQKDVPLEKRPKRNNLKDLKKPLKPVVRRKKRAHHDSEEDNQIYTDNMPLTDTIDPFVPISSDLAEYDQSIAPPAPQNDYSGTYYIEEEEELEPPPKQPSSEIPVQKSHQPENIPEKQSQSMNEEENFSYNDIGDEDDSSTPQNSLSNTGGKFHRTPQPVKKTRPRTSTDNESSDLIPM